MKQSRFIYLFLLGSVTEYVSSLEGQAVRSIGMRLVRCGFRDSDPLTALHDEPDLRRHSFFGVVPMLILVLLMSTIAASGANSLEPLPTLAQYADAEVIDLVEVMEEGRIRQVAILKFVDAAGNTIRYLDDSVLYPAFLAPKVGSKMEVAYDLTSPSNQVVALNMTSRAPTLMMLLGVIGAGLGIMKLAMNLTVMFAGFSVLRSAQDAVRR